jgi:hypothetical protein
MRSVSRSDARICYTSRTLSWTYDPRSGTYDFIFQICREMFVRTDSRSRRCSEPSWIDCLQQQDLMHHLQPRDVFVTSWFTFIPLALCFFLYHHTVDSADFEFGGSFIMLCTFYFIIMQFMLIMVYFPL